MRLAVDVVGFSDAAAACRSGNQITAMVTESLAGKLQGYAGMAGDDATSTDFAIEYDAAADESLQALVELTYAFSSLSRLLAVSGDNHGRAEAAAAGRVWNGDTSHSTSGFTHFRASAPPSSLGGNPSTLNTVEAWIIEHVEGFVWPGADIDRLLDAAAAWRSAADSVGDLEHQCREAAALLGGQQSPEVPLATAALTELRALIQDTAGAMLATAALTELRALIQDTAGAMLAIATSCQEYAEAVRNAHQRTLAIIGEICQMALEGVAISAVVGLLSSGLGAGAAGSAMMARIAAQTPRFHALLVTLRAASTKAATRLREARSRMAQVRQRAGKYPRVRDERGSIRLPGPPSGTFRSGWLISHEAPPGHTLRDHARRSIEELLEQCLRHKKKQASSFPSQLDAERFVSRAIKDNWNDIDAWRRSGNPRSFPLTKDMGEPTGVTVTKDGSVTYRSGVRVVLIPNESMPHGWQVLTAYPN
ncbi:RNase A-like domain-containing protein [Nocardioides houyundeii]|uniref:RNase A-like domain-containing protein n=1 Tax=Nocardioides houyundeii TaxID=2045452 RepID=UPI000C790781|nr:RNase A-like domain-containing protein [Nocardioides houyundeii]